MVSPTLSGCNPASSTTATTYASTTPTTSSTTYTSTTPTDTKPSAVESKYLGSGFGY